ncbi:MAG: hypothetical protein HY616_10665 [Candidatus Rokubacteria bacterium]|nr:hypothetical protein [Candidatus Rokubacteria bacterium]
MLAASFGALADSSRGTGAAIRRRPRTFLGAALAVFVLSILVPPLVLSIVRKPIDYFTVNPWLARLPEYVASPDVPTRTKVEKLSGLALFWFSADSPFGIEWGFAVDVDDLGRILLTSLLFGAYFALWLHRRDLGAAMGAGAWTARRGGVLGAIVSVFGLSTGPCSVMGCGAPVLPVVGLAFAGLSSTTLKFLTHLSVLAATAVIVLLALGVAYLGWLTGSWNRRLSLPVA